MPYETIVSGNTITAAWANASVRDQVVTPFATAAARDSAITAPVEGMVAYLADSDQLTLYTGAAWKVIHAPTTSYTPTISGWTLSNGSVSGKWQKNGDVWRVHVKYTIGSSDTVFTSGLQFSLPSGLTSAASIRQHGSGVLIDASDSNKRHTLLPEVDASATTITVLIPTGSGATLIGLTSASSPVPTTNDIVYVNIQVHE